MACPIIEDHGHIWGRRFETDECRILDRFESLLNQWAASGDADRLDAALDSFARRNATSLLWNVFMEAGAKHPTTLGLLMQDVLGEPLFLAHPDCACGGTALFGALHQNGDRAQRERLESLILELPKEIQARGDEPPEAAASRRRRAQDRLLGALKEPAIALGSLRDLRRERQPEGPLPQARRSEEARAYSPSEAEHRVVEERDAGSQDAANPEMAHLREALRPLLGEAGKPLGLQEVERHWSTVLKCENACRPNRERADPNSRDLWGHLAGVCRTIATHAGWPATDECWQVIRRILLQAASDPVPGQRDGDDSVKDAWPSWSWPAPRIDAAEGLPLLVRRLGQADEETAAALRRLAVDPSRALRFNLANGLGAMQRAAPELMWELVGTMVAAEPKFSVLDALVLSLDRLPEEFSEMAKPRLRAVAERASRDAPEDHSIHEALASSFLFRWLKTGDRDGEEHVERLIEECETVRAGHALSNQLHRCRASGCLTLGVGASPERRPDEIRAKTWRFFSRVLKAAQFRERGCQKELEAAEQAHPADVERLRDLRDRCGRLVNAVATQLYFGSGAFDHESARTSPDLTAVQLRRFWRESEPLLRDLAEEWHPDAAHHVVQTLHHLLPCEPSAVFLLAARTIRTGSQAGLQFESLAAGDVVRFVQRALADHREIFRSESGEDSPCMKALLDVLDLFVDAGWPQARMLAHRLEEIHR